MNTNEGMGRRECVGGAEMDHLTKAHRFYVENHGIRAKIKVARNKRVRRATRQALHNGQEG